MVVYVLETGCYEQRGIMGIYASAESAMAAHNPTPGRTRGDYTWKQSGDGCWTFSADWDDAADVTEWQVKP